MKTKKNCAATPGNSDQTIPAPCSRRDAKEPDVASQMRRFMGRRREKEYRRQQGCVIASGKEVERKRKVNGASLHWNLERSGGDEGDSMCI